MPTKPPAPPPLLRFGDRFQELEILGDVGQGGMGVVYRDIESENILLDKDGKAKVEGAAQGKCKVVFPRIARENWKRE